MKCKRYDELLDEIVSILRREHPAGDALPGFDPRYYNQAIGQAWHDDKLDELLFLRYINQMLACTGDRHLRLSLRPSDTYEPWSPGFFTRRFEDSLYVTAVTGDSRLSVGDRITAINGGSPAAHRANIQKNFFYAETPEREDWNGLLKMADSITVARQNGSEETLSLRRFPLAPAFDKSPSAALLPDGVFYLRPAPFDGSGRTAALLAEHQSDLAASRGVIVDVRNGWGEDEDEVLALLPLILQKDTPAAQLLDAEYYVNYTPLNCALRAEGMKDVPGAEAYIAELTGKAGAGLIFETAPAEDILPGRGRGAAVVLTDTFCRDAAESFALAAKRAGAYLLGRPTLGTADFCGDVRYALDDRFTLTWPTAITKAAHDGCGVLGRGVAPDEYRPWTPEELKTDRLLTRAREYLEKTEK